MNKLFTRRAVCVGASIAALCNLELNDETFTSIQNEYERMDKISQGNEYEDEEQTLDVMSDIIQTVYIGKHNFEPNFETNILLTPESESGFIYTSEKMFRTEKDKWNYVMGFLLPGCSFLVNCVLTHKDHGPQPHTFFVDKNGMACDISFRKPVAKEAFFKTYTNRDDVEYWTPTSLIQFRSVPGGITNALAMLVSVAPRIYNSAVAPLSIPSSPDMLQTPKGYSWPPQLDIACE